MLAGVMIPARNMPTMISGNGNVSGFGTSLLVQLRTLSSPYHFNFVLSLLHLFVLKKMGFFFFGCDFGVCLEK